MTDKNIDKAKGRVKEAAGALTGDRRLKNEGRVDRARALRRKPSTRPPTPSPAARETISRSRHARANSTKRWEVTMLTILLIVIVVLLLTGGVGYRRRSRRGV
jgi:hypothetical protein